MSALLVLSFCNGGRGLTDKIKNSGYYRMKAEEIYVDARNLPCPMPLLKLKQALKQAQAGQKIVLVATDKTSKRDIATYIGMTNHQMDYIESVSEISFTVAKTL
jgi:tRNA 2-thiouridine synthesizing protein A